MPNRDLMDQVDIADSRSCMAERMLSGKPNGSKTSTTKRVSSISGSVQVVDLVEHIFRNPRPRLWYFVECIWSALRKVARPLLDPQGNNFFQGVKFSVQTFSPGNMPNLMWLEVIFEPWTTVPEGLNPHLGLTDWVESMKFRDAQNCPAKEFVNLIQDLSTSSTTRNKIIRCAYFQNLTQNALLI